VLAWGLVALMAASAVGAVVDDGTLLIAARFVKGASAAFTAPAALSILSTSFSEGPHRNRALGVYTAAAACGFTFGLVSGGLLTEVSWRATFVVVVPVAAVLLGASLRVVRSDGAKTRDGRLDLGGAVTVTAAALLFTRAVVEAPTAGWLSLETTLGVLVAAALVVAFVVIERTVEQPLVRLGLLRSVPLVRANVGALLLFGCATVFNVVNTLYEQDVLGWGPLKTGLVFMVASITTGLLAPRMGALATRVGSTWVLLAGGVAMVGSFLVFLATGPTTSYPVIVTSLALMGAGFALAYPALNIQALAGVADDEQGLASGLIGSSLQIGGAVLLAISTAATLAFTPRHASAHQTVHGLHAGMCVALVGAGLITLIAAHAARTERELRTVALESA
jgi:MFS family permease